MPTDLANGTDYHIVLEDVLDPDTVSFSEAFTIGLTATLNPPVLYSPLDAATDQSASLALQWIDSNTTPQETKYQVRLKPKGGGYVTFNTAKDATSYMVTLNKAKKTYSWNVRAFGSGANIKNSGWANGGVDWSFTTQGVVTLAAPNLRSPTNAAIGQPSSLNLEWDDTNSETQELKYQIRIKKTGGGYSYHSTSQDATGYIVSLLPTKTYFWNVRAVGNGTNILSSAWANGGADWAFTTAAPATLNPPVLISPADNATDQPTTIVFQWQDTNSSLGEVAYKIRLKPAGGAYIYFNTARDASSYTKSGLLKNKAYYWNVQAKGDGKGILSSAWANAGVDWKFTTKK